MLEQKHKITHSLTQMTGSFVCDTGNQHRRHVFYIQIGMCDTCYIPRSIFLMKTKVPRHFLPICTMQTIPSFPTDA